MWVSIGLIREVRDAAEILQHVRDMAGSSHSRNERRKVVRVGVFKNVKKEAIRCTCSRALSLEPFSITTSHCKQVFPQLIHVEKRRYMASRDQSECCRFIAGHKPIVGAPSNIVTLGPNHQHGL